MDSQMAIDMMNCLGGSATVMGYSDIYTGMQQGVIDGAENNVTARRDHGDAVSYTHLDVYKRQLSRCFAVYSRVALGALRSGDSTHFFVSSIIRLSSFRVSVRTTSVTTSTALS